MDFLSYISGFMSALFLGAIILAAVYIGLKRKPEKGEPVKGYLDLISGLSQGQRLQVQEIRRTFLPRVEGIRQQLRLKRTELADLLFAEPAERPAIDTVADEILRCQLKLEREVIEHILEEKNLLSVSQRRKFYQIIVDQFSAGGLGVHDIKSRKN
jgi:Heavy-metal resistance